MSNHVSHAALPFPVKGARFTVAVPYLDADGDPTDPTTPDTEFSLDAGAFADCAEEVSTISGSNGVGYLTLTGAETNGSLLAVVAKVASGPKATIATLYPRVLPVLESGTAQAGANGSITLTAGAAAFDIAGCIVKTTGGTGGGGTGGANNQARVITAYNTSTKVATVVPNWEANPGNDTTYEILLTDMAGNAAVTRALRPTTDGRTLDVTATGAAGVDWGNVENKTTSNDLSATTISTSQAVASVSGAVGSVSGHTVQTGDSYSLLTSAMADSIPSDGTRPSPIQALYMTIQFLIERAVSGTTLTVKKVDGSTSLFTCTLDDGTSPTSITRSS